MTPDAEAIADRRRLRRKLSLWRVLAVAAGIVALIAIGYRLAPEDGLGLVEGRRHVARVSVEGFIGDQRRMAELFERLAKSEATSAVVVAIDSPGGTTTGAEELYRGIRWLSERKPTVAFVDGTAASGGYIAALGAERIVARETALVGSIGVLFQYPEVTQLLETIGVRVQEIKSSPLKAAPSGVTPTSPEARQALQNVVDDTYAWFKGLVASRRALTPAELAAVADGRVHSGRQALGLKLVDALGSERDAVRWLEAEKGIPAGLPVRDWKPKRDGETFDLFAAAAVGADALGFDALGRGLRAVAGTDRLALDGLLALWQPPTEK